MTDLAAYSAFVAVLAFSFALVALIFGSLVVGIISATVGLICAWLALEDPFH